MPAAPSRRTKDPPGNPPRPPPPLPADPANPPLLPNPPANLPSFSYTCLPCHLSPFSTPAPVRRGGGSELSNQNIEVTTKEDFTGHKVKDQAAIEEKESMLKSVSDEELRIKALVEDGEERAKKMLGEEAKRKAEKDREDNEKENKLKEMEVLEEQERERKRTEIVARAKIQAKEERKAFESRQPVSVQEPNRDKEDKTALTPVTCNPANLLQAGPVDMSQSEDSDFVKLGRNEIEKIGSESQTFASRGQSQAQQIEVDVKREIKACEPALENAKKAGI